MVTNDTLTAEYIGLSTDTKPTENIRNGSTFVEMDTKKLYAFDEENGEWKDMSE